MMVLASVPRIPGTELTARIKRARLLIRKAGLDALLVTSHEADFANVRYFSNHWTLFEIAGVLIPAEGEPALLIGPESETYARNRSAIPNIHKLVEYRESADPAYSGVAVSTYRDVFASCGLNNPRRIGLGGYSVTPAPLLESLRQSFPEAELVSSDEIMVKLRSVKSENELARLRRVFEISEVAGVEAHAQTIDWMQKGTPARDVTIKYRKLFNERGYEKNFLYGPCYGLGMMEVERPWLEETSSYNLEPGMAFQIDTFLYGNKFD